MLAVRDRLMVTGNHDAAGIAAAVNAVAADTAVSITSSEDLDLSSASSSSPSLSSSSLSPSLLPSFDEVEAKLLALRQNLRSNPLPVDARLELEGRLEEFGAEIARWMSVSLSLFPFFFFFFFFLSPFPSSSLPPSFSFTFLFLRLSRLKHIRELKKKDAIAASIYDQLSTTMMTGEEERNEGRIDGDEAWGRKAEQKSEAKFGRFAVRKLELVLEGNWEMANGGRR